MPSAQRRGSPCAGTSRRPRWLRPRPALGGPRFGAPREVEEHLRVEVEEVGRGDELQASRTRTLRPGKHARRAPPRVRTASPLAAPGPHHPPRRLRRRAFRLVVTPELVENPAEFACGFRRVRGVVLLAEESVTLPEVPLGIGEPTLQSRDEAGLRECVGEPPALPEIVEDLPRGLDMCPAFFGSPHHREQEPQVLTRCRLSDSAVREALDEGLLSGEGVRERSLSEQEGRSDVRASRRHDSQVPDAPSQLERPLGVIEHRTRVA